MAHSDPQLFKVVDSLAWILALGDVRAYLNLPKPALLVSL